MDDKSKIGAVGVPAAVPQEIAVQRAEIDSAVATARACPRSIGKFLAESEENACRTAGIAESCIYSVPRAGKNIGGPSVRLAEIMLNAYGNAAARATITRSDERYIYALGVCRDLEKNVLIEMEVRRRITDKHGNTYNDDMIQTTGNAAASVALRNVIFRVIPRSYVDEIYQKAVDTAVGNSKTFNDKKATVLAYLQKQGVSLERVLFALDQETEADITKEDLAALIGMSNRIREEEADIDELFPEPPKSETPAQRAARIKAANAAPETNPPGDPPAGSQQEPAANPQGEGAGEDNVPPADTGKKKKKSNLFG